MHVTGRGNLWKNRMNREATSNKIRNKTGMGGVKKGLKTEE